MSADTIDPAPPAVTEHTVRDSILASASTNSDLLVRLASTETAPGDLAVHQAAIEQLKRDVSEQTDILSTLKEQVDTKFHAHKRYADNRPRRLLYRASFMSEKLNRKRNLREKEYFSILSVQSHAEKRFELLQSALEAAERVEGDLEAKAQDHGDTHAKIDELYEELFAGPTPGFPREDSLESRFYVARGAHESVRQKIITARKAARELATARRNVARADRAFGEAIFEARNHFLHFDGATRSLNAAGREIEYAILAMREAGDVLQPKSRELDTISRSVIETLEQAKPNTPTQSNREAYIAIAQTSKVHLTQTRKHMTSFLEALKSRERTGLNELSKTARTLEDARQMLMQARMGIFEEVAGFGEAAPSYKECCDRAEGFCEVPFPVPIAGEEEDGVVSPVLPDYEDAMGVGEDGGVEVARRSVSPLEDELEAERRIAH